MFHCDELVPGVDVSGYDSADQERHGGRRLLQEMDNSSLEEIEGEGSKNCTAPGKDERKRTPECSPAQPPSLPPSPPAPLPPSLRGWKKGTKGGETNDRPHMCCFSTLSAPSVLASWCGVTQFARSGDFPWAQAAAGAVHFPSHAGFTLIFPT